MAERIYVVAYDISSQKRWRRVFRTMEGYGEWLQLSIFQCRLSAKQHMEMIAKLSEHINHDQDHVLILDIGPANAVEPRVTSLGKKFDVVEHKPIIV